jgi:hypothetical protein
MLCNDAPTQDSSDAVGLSEIAGTSPAMTRRD